MQEVKDKPSISPRSRDIALNSARFCKPLHSPERYRQEVEKYVTKKEEAARLKYLQMREKEIAEEQHMIANSVHNGMDKKLPMGEFLRKYNNQVRMWEARA